MKVVAVYYPKHFSYDLLEYGNEELVDGGFQTLEEVEEYCNQYKYIVVEIREK